MSQVLLAFLIGLGVSQFALLLTTVYLHRALSHKALTVSRPVALVFRLLLWMTTGIRPRQWVAVHRRHHAFTDIEGDPHSPILLGYWQVQLGNVYFYKKSIKEGDPTMRYAKDLPPDRLDAVLFDHAFLGLGIGIAFLCVVFGWQVGLMIAGFHTVIYLMLNAAVNAVGHKFGKRTYQNIATNNLWLALLAGGEGWHNNHHAIPTSARLGLKKSQIDPGYWLIWALAKTGQSKVRLSATKAAASAAARDAVAGASAAATNAAAHAAAAASSAAASAAAAAGQFGNAVANAVHPGVPATSSSGE